MSDNPRKKRLRILSTALNLERIPLIGFGTYAVKPPQAIYNALSIGYRHLDLAANYNNLQNVKQQQQLAVAPLTKGGLGIEVNEMICLWEALFPDDQNYFQLHQIKDLVSSIPVHGSMFAWSELFGEQALGITKDVVFYRHFDLRAQVVYERITKEEHLESAWEAREKNANRKTVEDIKVKGFKDVWPFDRLPYSDLARNSSPPPCHASAIIACMVTFKENLRHSQGRYL